MEKQKQMNDQPCRQPCRDDPRCDTCDELFHAYAPCLDCRELGFRHYVNMLDANCDGGLSIPGPEVSELM